MPVRFYIVMLGLALVACIMFVNEHASARNAYSEQSTPDRWQTITNDPFSFQLPADMEETRNMPDHTGAMRSFTGRRVLLFWFNYAVGSCDTLPAGTNKPGVEQTVVDIRGRKGILTSGPSPNPGHFLASICFADIADHRRLAFHSVCLDHDALNLAKEIFGTVEIRDQ
jgi:hypothetical protein